MDSQMSLSKISNLLLTSFEKEETRNLTNGINVNRIISELATWYEKLRNAMDYREEEVIRRSAIERILKRRLFLGEKAKQLPILLSGSSYGLDIFPKALLPKRRLPVLQR